MFYTVLLANARPISWWKKRAKQTVHIYTPCGLQPTLRQMPCLGEQPGLQLALPPITHRWPWQDLLSRRTALSFAIGHQERVLFEADRLGVHQAFLFVSREYGWINGCWWASTIIGGRPVRRELGSMRIICILGLESMLRIMTGTGLWVHVARGFCGVT